MTRASGSRKAKAKPKAAPKRTPRKKATVVREQKAKAATRKKAARKAAAPEPERKFEKLETKPNRPAPPAWRR